MTVTTTTVTYAFLFLAALLIPGNAFLWGYERHREIFARSSRDWPFRLVAVSATILGLSAWPFYWMASNYWSEIRDLKPIPWWLFCVPVLYPVICAAAGVGCGRVARMVKGGRASPNAWAQLFERGYPGMIRCKLKSGRWVGGYYGFGSHASAQGPTTDVYISEALHFNADGQPMWTDSGAPAWVGGENNPTGILVQWEDVETLEFTPWRKVGR